MRVNNAGPLRRLGALLYDALLVIALLMVTTALFLVATGGEAITIANGWLAYLYRITLLCVATTFFVYFWTAKGRTLGMQAWRIRIESVDGALPTKLNALKRLAMAAIPWLPGLCMTTIAIQSHASKIEAMMAYGLFVLVPLNYCSAWFDPQQRSWHDRFLQTRIVFRK